MDTHFGQNGGSLFFPYPSMRIPKVMILVMHYDDFSQQMALHNWSNNFLLWTCQLEYLSLIVQWLNCP